MPRHHEVRELPYSAEQMYALVADVGRYAEFLPWISAVRVRSDSETEMIADLLVGFKSLRERFTSRVIKQFPSRIHVDYIEGPLKQLHNDWLFRPTATGCELDFTVEFTFKNSLFEKLAGQVFDKAVRRMTQAFEDRANALYGSSSSSATSVA